MRRKKEEEERKNLNNKQTRQAARARAFLLGVWGDEEVFIYAHYLYIPKLWRVGKESESISLL